MKIIPKLRINILNLNLKYIIYKMTTKKYRLQNCRFLIFLSLLISEEFNFQVASSPCHLFPHPLCNTARALAPSRGEAPRGPFRGSQRKVPSSDKSTFHTAPGPCKSMQSYTVISTFPGNYNSVFGKIPYIISYIFFH